MAVRTMGVSEARRLLPRIVRTIADEGGRVDVTMRGEPRVSIVRTSEFTRSMRDDARSAVGDALRVEFAVPPDTLVDVVRALRARVARPRAPAADRRRSRRSK